MVCGNSGESVFLSCNYEALFQPEKKNRTKILLVKKKRKKNLILRPSPKSLPYKG
jgi:hypothetical protein